jgi:general stress protein CsbA
MIFTAYYMAYFDTFKCIQIRALSITIDSIYNTIRQESKSRRTAHGVNNYPRRIYTVYR